jgi:hypothetical protein
LLAANIEIYKEILICGLFCSLIFYINSAA